MPTGMGNAICLASKRKVTFWQKKSNKNHKWWCQLQGALNITNALKCYLCLLSNNGIFHQVITKDEIFWDKKLLEKQKLFYANNLLPEKIDSRYKRNMVIRD